MATPPPPQFRDDVIALIPALRAFARALSNNPADADDLVQDVIVKAWSYYGQFTPGTNLRAWLFTILRNRYYSNLKRRQREVADPEGSYTASMTVAPAQQWSVMGKELKGALMKLPNEQREAIILVAAAGMSYEEAANICGCAIGTIKSRVNRARLKLAELMNLEGASVASAGEPDAMSATGT